MVKDQAPFLWKSGVMEGIQTSASTRRPSKFLLWDGTWAWIQRGRGRGGRAGQDSRMAALTALAVESSETKSKRGGGAAALTVGAESDVGTGKPRR